MAARDDIQQIAAALARPGPGYIRRLEQAQETISPRSVEAARQLGVFADRIADLSIEELRELYDETFGAEGATIRPLVRCLVRQRTGPIEAAAALSTLAPLLDRLDAERNPHAYAVRSLCCLLLHRVSDPQVQGGARSIAARLAGRPIN